MLREVSSVQDEPLVLQAEFLGNLFQLARVSDLPEGIADSPIRDVDAIRRDLAELDNILLRGFRWHYNLGAAPPEPLDGRPRPPEFPWERHLRKAEATQVVNAHYLLDAGGIPFKEEWSSR